MEKGEYDAQTFIAELKSMVSSIVFNVMNGH